MRTARPGPGRLAPHQLRGDTQLQPHAAHLVLEQVPQGLYQALKADILRQAAHVVVALDDGRLAGAALHHVRVDGALAQEVHLAQLFALRLEDTDELLTDNLPLALRVGDAESLEKNRSAA